MRRINVTELMGGAMSERADIAAGTRFGKLKIIEEVEPYVISSGQKYRMFRCECDCGNDVIRGLGDLRSGKSIQCKSCRYHHESLIGRKYGELLVVAEAENDKFNKVSWVCACDCGNRVVVAGERLKNGTTKSCGCLSARMARERTLIDNRTNSRIYRVYYGMLQRCNNSNSPHYDLWGGRGITVCDAWKNDFCSFRDWATSHGYSDELTIDRIDNNGNYEPSNCRWVTHRVQSRNKRNNRRVSLNGETHLLDEWSAITGIKFGTLVSRYHRGWSPLRMLNTPVKRGG